MRRPFISVTWTPGVDTEDARTMIRVIEDVYRLLRRHLGRPGQFDPLPVVRVFGAWTIPACPPDGVYCSMDWFLEHSVDESGERILASRYLENIRLEPWQATTPHFDFCLTDLAILDDRNRANAPVEVLGVSRRGMVSLISAHPFVSLPSDNLRALALRQMVAHYLGHMFDVPRPGRPEGLQEQDGIPYCTGTCAMRFTGTPTQALMFAREQAAGNVIYCPACQQDLLAQIIGYHYGLN